MNWTALSGGSQRIERLHESIVRVFFCCVASRGIRETVDVIGSLFPGVFIWRCILARKCGTWVDSGDCPGRSGLDGSAEVPTSLRYLGRTVTNGPQ
jgi:hypothetical protein